MFHLEKNENGKADLINFVLYYGLFIFGGCLITPVELSLHNEKKLEQRLITMKT